jgi:hypothetical protein
MLKNRKLEACQLPQVKTGFRTLGYNSFLKFFKCFYPGDEVMTLCEKAHQCMLTDAETGKGRKMEGFSLMNGADCLRSQTTAT